MYRKVYTHQISIFLDKPNVPHISDKQYDIICMVLSLKETDDKIRYAVVYSTVQLLQ